MSPRKDFEYNSDSAPNSPILQTFSTESKRTKIVSLRRDSHDKQVPTLHLRQMIHQREVLDDSINMDLDSKPINRFLPSSESSLIITIGQDVLCLLPKS